MRQPREVLDGDRSLNRETQVSIGIGDEVLRLDQLEEVLRCRREVGHRLGKFDHVDALLPQPLGRGLHLVADRNRTSLSLNRCFRSRIVASTSLSKLIGFFGLGVKMRWVTMRTLLGPTIPRGRDDAGRVVIERRVDTSPHRQASVGHDREAGATNVPRRPCR